MSMKYCRAVSAEGDDTCWASRTPGPHWSPTGVAYFLVLAVLLFSWASRLNGQVSISESTLNVSAQGDLPMFWHTLEGGIREESSGTTGYFKIENVADRPLREAVFYAAYYDLSGRLCFSLVLSQAASSPGQAELPPGESVLISSTAVGLFPAVEPTEAKLFLVQLKVSGQEALQKWDAPIRAPVTILDGSGSALQLAPQFTAAPEPVQDLILGTVTVGDRGVVENVGVLYAASRQAEQWFRDFVQKTSFYPATEGSVLQAGKALLLVRAVVKEGDVQSLVLPPQQSPSVKFYLQSQGGDFAIPITNILLVRPATQINKLTKAHEVVTINKPPAPPGLLELANKDTYWSSPAAKWVRDDSMPHHLRREVTAPLGR